MRNAIFLKALTTTAAILVTAALVQGQDPARHEARPARPTKPAPRLRKIKIWTNEDVPSLRSPADEYLLQKEAKAQKEAQSQANAVDKPSSGTKPSGQSSAHLKLPASLEEADNAIKGTIADIHDQEDTLARLAKEKDDSPQDQKAERAKEIERRTAVLQESQKELKALQGRREELAGRAASANSNKAVTSALATSSCDPATSSCLN